MIFSYSFIYIRKFQMFKISLDALQILDAIDRGGSFVAASNELFKVPSTISYTVNKLEQDLGVKVFDRFGPRVALTKAGAELLKEGRYLMKAAEDLEHRIKRVASGWETELTIGLDSAFSASVFIEDVKAFYQVADRTRIRFLQESLSGTWEALLDCRVDLLIGAAGEGPSGGGYNTVELGKTEFVFVVSPEHPLAKIETSIGKAEMHQHCAVVVGDTVRKSAPRTVGLIFGQDAIAVPDMQAKYEYQLAGVGFGFLPEPMARQAIADGRLVVKTVDEPRKPESLQLAWRTCDDGAGLQWWIARMQARNVLEEMWSYAAH